MLTYRKPDVSSPCYKYECVLKKNKVFWVTTIALLHDVERLFDLHLHEIEMWHGY